jgi:formamidase
MKSRITAVLAAVAAATLAAPVWADTADVKTQSWVRVKKTGAHCADDPNCMNRYHPAIPAVATARPGQLILFETRDALDSELNVNSVGKDLAAVDLNLVHPITGPVYIEGAKRGDVLAVTLIDVDPDEYGYTTIVPGFGFLRDRYTEPFIANWRLNRLEAVSDQVPGVAIPMNGFMGTVGTLPGPGEVDTWLARETQLGEAGGIALPPQPTGARPAAVCGPNGSHKDKCLRTIPPRENGGNMDIKQMVVGTTLLLPCYIDGCGLFVGDVHYAQGDGEVAGTAIEMGAKVTVRTQIRRGMLSMIKGGPHFEGGSQIKKLEPDRFYATVGYPLKKAGEVPPQHKYLDSAKLAPLSNLNEDLTQAARSSLIDMIEWLMNNKGMTSQQAYVFTSVACDLRIGNVVDVPNYAVSTICPLEVFQK